MALTKFPIEVTEPTVDVVLPVGEHTLELVVEDDLGLKSAPAVVVVTVKQEAAMPVITGIDPKSGGQGATMEAVITGENLEGATEVRFVRRVADRVVFDESVVAEILEVGPERIAVAVQIAADAEPGVRNFRVTTPAGTAQSPLNVTFTVEGEVELPVIEGIEPDSGEPGDKLEATIYGANLEDAGKVVFLREGKPDSTIEASIEETSPEKLLVLVIIASDAPPGERDFTVTTPAGTGKSAKPFAVVETEELPVVEGIEPDSGKPGDKLEATIYGANLEDTGKVVFLREGKPDSTIEASIEETSPEKLLVLVIIASDAPPGERDFIVTTPAGTGKSTKPFIVLGAGKLPAVEGIVPASGGEGEKLAVIYGANLEGAKTVTFLSKEKPDEAVVGEIRGGKDKLVTMLAAGMLDLTEEERKIVVSALERFDALVISILIEPTATSGARSFTVTTAAGTAKSPVGVTFTVEAGGLVPIRTIEEVSGIGPASTTRLADVGITDLGKLAAAEPAYVAETLGVSEERATEFVKEAKRLLGVPGVELSERSVEEVSGIGPASAASLAEFGITDLAEMAAMEPARLAKMLEVSEDRAAGFVKGAQELLTR